MHFLPSTKQYNHLLKKGSFENITPKGIKSSFTIFIQNHYTMFKNNLKIALRSLRKNKIYTIINVVGLTVGIAAALLIFRMVDYELSFNKSFENYDRIVRVYSERTTPEGVLEYTVCTPVPSMDAMENVVSQFAAMSRIKEMWANLTVPNPNGGAPLKKFAVEDAQTAMFVEPDFFEVFQLDWLAGESTTALDQPNTIVLTQSWAERLFDNWEAAMDQAILIDNLIPITVKGVVADLPDNVDFNYPYLISYSTLNTYADYFFHNSEDWGSCSSNDQVYALLTSPDQIDNANALLATVGKEQYSQRTGKQSRFHMLQPLSDLHYNEDLGHSGHHRTAISRLRILGAIGILILIMACFNFINLATAQASLRAKEVGVRKTLGSSRRQLIGQFMSETGLIVGLAILLGTLLATLSRPLLSHISDVPADLPFLSRPIVWGFLAGITVIITLLAGLYPSFALSNFKPVRALKSKADNNTWGGAAIRKSLVVLQFVIAQGLIIGAVITILQLDFIRNRDLGFDDQLVYTFSFNSDSTTISRQSALKQNLLNIPSVEAVSFNSDQPFSGNTWASNFRYSSRPEDEDYGITLKFTDADYQKTYGLELTAGRWLTPSDTMREAVVNETLLRKLGVQSPEEVINEPIRLGSSRHLRIVGVVKDFHTHSLRQEHLPLMMATRKDYYWDAGVKIRPGDLSGTTAEIKKAFDDVLPEQVFNGDFLDQNITQFYENDNRLAATCKAFGLLAILISCLGLFGLATHAANQRVKEIGIRKVLGASLAGILGLLSKDFLKLVILALIIASPIAWWLMNRWLDNFVYRIDINWWVFLLAGVLVIFIAFATVSFQSIKAALADPVKSLRNE